MDKELKIMSENYQLDQLYKNNLFTLKSICQLLGVWENYTPEQQFQLENFTKRDTEINRHFDFKGSYNSNYVYGEIMRNGVETIIEKIKRYKKISDKDVFVDVGSGSGKVVLHLSIRTDIKTLVGVEIVPQRNRYSKYIQKNTSTDKAVFFIEKDILNFDLSPATIVFINDVFFDDELTINIYQRLSSGCHIITSKKIEDCKILKGEFFVGTSWGSKLKLFYYIK